MSVMSNMVVFAPPENTERFTAEVMPLVPVCCTVLLYYYTRVGSHLCCRKLVWEFIWLLWNPLPLLQTPQDLLRRNTRYWDTSSSVYKPSRNYFKNTYKLHTHSNDRIQQPRAMPNRILRVRRWPQDTTWVVLSQTRSTIENPPSVATTWTNVCCFLQEADETESIRHKSLNIYFYQLSHRRVQNVLHVCTHSVGMLVMTNVLITWKKDKVYDRIKIFCTSWSWHFCEIKLCKH